MSSLDGSQGARDTGDVQRIRRGWSLPTRLRQEVRTCPLPFPSLVACQVVADYEDRGYRAVRDTEIGVVLRHPNGGVVTVLANGETRGGDKAGPGKSSSTAWWGEPAYISPE